MKIAQIANNWSKFDPVKAIGISAVVRDVSLGLQKKGHNVTVFAAEGSIFPGINLRCVGKSFKDLGISLFHPDSPRAQTTYIEKIVPELIGFDIVHSHVEHVMLPFIKDLSMPVISTIHGADFMPREQAIFQKYPNENYVALSEGAKRALPYIHFSYVVHNGISLEEITFYSKSKSPSYLAWMGRFSENKGVLYAIEAARESKEVLFLEGFKETGQEKYLAEIMHLVDGSTIQILEKMDRKARYAFVGNAKAFLFPIHWEEPFGLVMPEAMAGGTPVIAYNRGSVPDVVEDGITGFIIDPDNAERPGKGTWIIKKQGIEGLVEAVRRIGEIDRLKCRKRVEDNFTVDKMADNYEKVYTQVLI